PRRGGLRRRLARPDRLPPTRAARRQWGHSHRGPGRHRHQRRGQSRGPGLPELRQTRREANRALLARPAATAALARRRRQSGPLRTIHAPRMHPHGRSPRVGLPRRAPGGDANRRNPLAALFVSRTDWDAALRNANRWSDRLVAALRQKDRASRVEELRRFDDELVELKVQAMEGTSKVSPLVPVSPAARGEAIGNILITLLLPAASKVQDST